ncbi:MAG TPA: hypothetical protein VGL92_10915, partial [Acidimicrobiia bacterium]
MSDGTIPDVGLPAGGLPEALLAPLLELAGDVLQALPAADVPAAARRLATFDRRGLATPTARAQLRRLLETEEQMAKAVADAYAQSPEAATALDGWDPAEAAARVTAAAGDGSLPGLASALYATRPPGWEFALGLAAAAFEAGREGDSLAGQVRSLEERVANLEEAKRRAEVARAAAEAQAGTLDTQLKEARRARRAGEERVIAELAETRARVEELEAELAEAVRRRGEAEAQFKAEARRAAAEQKARTEAERTAAESAAAPPEPVPPPPPPGPDPVLAEAAQAAARLAEAIEGTARLAVELGELLTPGGAGPPSSDAVSAIEEPPPRPAR